METETYKSAKLILEKYAPDQLRKSGTSPSSTELTLVKSSAPSLAPETGMYYTHNGLCITYRVSHLRLLAL